MRLPKWVRSALLLGLGAILGIVIALVVRSLTIRTPLERVTITGEIPAVSSPRFLRLVELHTGTGFTHGNHVELLLDGGETFPRLWADLRAARRSIDLQLYFCQPGALADSLAAALVDRAGAGVRVRFLYDGFACNDLGDDYFARLRSAGIRTLPFRPVHWWSLHKAQARSHVRIVVIDGTIGYTGGFGIDDRWSAAGEDGEPGWRDTNVRFTGPAVAQLNAGFADAWAETSGELVVVEPAPAGSIRASGVIAGLMHSVPDRGSTTAERLLALSIVGARHSLYIANAYFVPDADFRRMLLDAAARGVDVRVLTPDASTDVPIVRYAARARYPELLGGGVGIWEYAPTMMHAKTFVVDGAWVSIGSMNFDNRSLAVNIETTLLVDDPALGARMDSIFLDDLARATGLTAASFAERGAWEKLKERLAVLAARFL